MRGMSRLGGSRRTEMTKFESATSFVLAIAAQVLAVGVVLAL
jgi:hypothetical protein